jgi:hypothetical protein
VGDVHDGPKGGDNQKYAYEKKEAMTHVSLSKPCVGVRTAFARITGIGPMPLVLTWGEAGKGVRPP